MRRDRAGVVLLEAMIALAVLAVVGASLVALSGESVVASRRARASDEEFRRASAFLDVVALWTRDDLTRRLGDRPQGPWRLRIDEPTEALFLVALADSTGRVLLRTEFFRSRAQP